MTKKAAIFFSCWQANDFAGNRPRDLCRGACVNIFRQWRRKQFYYATYELVFFFETKQKNLRFQKYPDTWNLDITNDFLYPSNSKICEKEPQFNLEIFSFLKMLCYVRKIMKA